MLAAIIHSYHNSILLMFLLVTLCSKLAAQQADITVEDDTGFTVSLEKPAKRVISLAPHLTEILFELDAGDRIVATVAYSDYPQLAKKIPRLGDALSISVESIISLQPDIVFAWYSGNSMRVIERIRSLGIDVYVNEAETLEGIIQSLLNIGSLVGKDNIAKKLYDDYMQQLSMFQHRYQSSKSVKIFYQVWHNPLLSVNKQHLIGQAIALCGGDNIFADLDYTIPNVNQEAIILANPDIIFAAPHGTRTDITGWQEYWERYSSINAVKNRHLINLPADLISRPSSRILQGINLLCRHIDNVRSVEFFDEK